VFRPILTITAVKLLLSLELPLATATEGAAQDQDPARDPLQKNDTDRDLDSEKLLSELPRLALWFTSTTSTREIERGVELGHVPTVGLGRQLQQQVLAL